MFKRILEFPRFVLKAGLGGVEYGIGFAALGAVLLGVGGAGFALWNAENWYDMKDTWTPMDDKLDYAALKETLQTPSWTKVQLSNLPLAVAVGAVGYGAYQQARGGGKHH